MRKPGFCIDCYNARRVRVDAVARIDGDDLCRLCVDKLAKSRVVVEAPVSAPASASSTVKMALKLKPVEPPVGAVGLCSRGCGKPTHRGWCVGQQAKKPALPAAVPMEEMEVLRADPLDEAAVVDASIAEVLESATKAPARLLVDARGCSDPAEVEAAARRVIVAMQPHVIASIARPLAAPSRYTVTGPVAKVVRLEDVPVDPKAVGRAPLLWSMMLALKPTEALEILNRDERHAGTTFRDLRDKAKKAGRSLYARRVGTGLFVSFSPLPGDGGAR